MTYTEMYKELKKQDKRAVMDALNIDKQVIKKYCDGEYSDQRRAIIEREIDRVYRHQEALRTISFTFDECIQVSFKGTNYVVTYLGLMAYKLQIDEDIHDLTHIKEILDNSETAIKHLYKENPFEIKNLITKYITQ